MNRLLGLLMKHRERLRRLMLPRAMVRLRVGGCRVRV